MSRKLQEALQKIERYDGHYQRKAVNYLLAHPDESIPKLLEILKKVAEKPEAYANNRFYAGHVYALLLLSHFEEPRAHPLIVELASLPGETVFDLFGDLVTENLDAALYRTCDDDFDLIWQMVARENGSKKINEFARIASVGALEFGVAFGQLARTDLLDPLAAQLEEVIENGVPSSQDTYYLLLAGTFLDLHPLGYMAVIERAYEHEVFSTTFASLEMFQELIEGATIEESLAEKRERFRKSHGHGDFHAYVQWCFTVSKESQKEMEIISQALEKTREILKDYQLPGRKKK